MPTRFARQLAQLFRGAVAIGLDRGEALQLTIRCARDSMPPLRLALLEDLAQHPCSVLVDAQRRLGLPRATVDRQLQALHILRAVDLDDLDKRWRYTLAEGIDPTVLSIPAELPEKLVDVHRDTKKSEQHAHALTNKSGNSADRCDHCGLRPPAPGRKICKPCADNLGKLIDRY